MFTLIIWVCVNQCSIAEITGTYDKKESCEMARSIILDQNNLSTIARAACIPSPENGYFE